LYLSSDENFDTAALKSEKLVVVEFYMENTGPSMIMKGRVET